MYTDLKHFLCYKKKLCSIHRPTALRQPPHLNSVTILPSKTISSANIDAAETLLKIQHLNKIHTISLAEIIA